MTIVYVVQEMPFPITRTVVWALAGTYSTNLQYQLVNVSLNVDSRG
jgi:hypothetical protein